MNLLSKILRKLKTIFSSGQTPAQLELETLKERGLRIGNHVDIFTEYPFDSLYPGLISIGNYVTISTNVKILAHDASMGYITDGACKIGRVDIGDYVFIGHGSTILCNVRIGDHAIIGAGSVVTTDVPPYTVYEGNPARYIKTTDEFAKQHRNAIDIYPTIERSWQELAKMKANDWNDIRHDLKDTFGYIVRNKKD